MKTVIERAIGHWKAAKWHYNHAKESAIPDEHIESSNGLKALCVDMLNRPHLYAYTGELTDWQVFKKN